MIVSAENRPASRTSRNASATMKRSSVMMPRIVKILMNFFPALTPTRITRPRRPRREKSVAVELVTNAVALFRHLMEILLRVIPLVSKGAP